MLAVGTPWPRTASSFYAKAYLHRPLAGTIPPIFPWVAVSDEALFAPIPSQFRLFEVAADLQKQRDGGLLSIGRTR